MIEFKIGDLLKCIDGRFESDISHGKLYEVASIFKDSDDHVMIIDDTGEEWPHKKNRFVKVEKEWTPKKGETVLIKLGKSGWTEREFILDLGVEYNKRYICKDGVDPRDTCNWEVVKQVEEPTEFTMDEIAEKLGIPVERLKIKK